MNEILHIYKNIPKLINICEEVGNLQLKFHKTKIEYTSKENNTPVTDIDIKSSNIITKKIKDFSNEIPIISEENYQGINIDSCFWIIDPLDGTRNYINEGNQFCINIAFVKNNYPIFGMIYSPIEKKVFYAIEGQGSFLKEENKEPALININKMNSNLVNIYTSCSMNEKKLNLLISKIPNAKINKFSSALKFAAIASGDGCFYPRLGPTHEWDTAAGQCIVEEAGGIVVDKNMSRFRYNKNDTYLNKEFFVIADPKFNWKTIINQLCD
jgi:3'(2'), 5'-bisphosphate nucleotidase